MRASNAALATHTAARTLWVAFGVRQKGDAWDGARSLLPLRAAERAHDRLAALPSRTAASCSTAKSRSAISWSADTCTRMRASPLGTTG